jgi:DNA polymerase I-like protein with 3'-5' exonuclease and polymerase domains
MNSYQIGQINIQTTTDDNPGLLVIADAPSQQGWQEGRILPPRHLQLVQELTGSAWQHGVALISPCPPVPSAIDTNDRLTNEFLNQHRQEFLEALSYYSPRCIITLGKLAVRQLAGHSVKITQARGSFKTYNATGDTPVMPTLSPAHVLSRPEVRPLVEIDLRQVGVLAENDWQIQDVTTMRGLDYKWCLDLQPLLDNPPKAICSDVETVGVTWWNRKVVLVVQLSYKEGQGLMVPLDIDYFNNPNLRGETTKNLPRLTKALQSKLIRQLKQLHGNPDIAFTGHKFKFDCHHLGQYGIEVANWAMDTLQGAAAIDENMRQKSMDECVRRWVIEMSGYADAFNEDPIHEGKSRMDKVPHDDMLMYGCGDVDAGLRLARFMVPEIKKDARQWNVFSRVKLPALRTFLNMEHYGIAINRDALRRLGEYLKEREATEYKALIAEAIKKAPVVCRKHAEKGLKFSRRDFVRDLLFTKDGWGLTPVKFTKGTEKLIEEDQEESTSAKDHLPFFDHIPFISGREGKHEGLIAYQKLVALKNNFVGGESTSEWIKQPRLKNGEYGKRVNAAYEAAGKPAPPAKSQPVRRRSIEAEEEPEPVIVSQFVVAGVTYGEDAKGDVYRLHIEEAKGYWQYLEEGDPDAIHADFGLDNAVTGRSSCRNPNCQNWSKRGKDAKLFRSIFVARPGWTLIQADLSQAELRVAAVMANEPTMLRIYREGGDIHAYTAARCVHVPFATFAKNIDSQSPLYDFKNDWPGADGYLKKHGGKEGSITIADYLDYLRFTAKGVNFGYVFGMWWKNYRSYAKTNYGINVTDKEAKESREAFFKAYPGLEQWHQGMKAFARKHKYVRALHGALRRLPNIDSVDENIRQDCERQAINSPVQGFSSDLGLMGISRFDRDCDHDKMRVIGFIHDAGIIEARNDYVEEASTAIKWYMENPPLKEWFDLDFPIPIVSDIEVGPSLDKLEKKKQTLAVCPSWFTGD